MEPAKLQFSAHEMNFMGNADWILTKNDILNKVNTLMGELNVDQRRIAGTLCNPLPEEVLTTTAKISRGENYKGLPYLVLDYPRLFAKNNIFAVRTMFWWGRYLSTTLHLSGKWQQIFAEMILQRHQFLTENSFLVATGSNEWDHDVTGDAYAPSASFSKEKLGKMFSEKPFLKLALFAPVAQLADGIEIWQAQFEKTFALF